MSLLPPEDRLIVLSNLTFFFLFPCPYGVAPYTALTLNFFLVHEVLVPLRIPPFPPQPVPSRQFPSFIGRNNHPPSFLALAFPPLVGLRHSFVSVPGICPFINGFYSQFSPPLEPSSNPTLLRSIIVVPFHSSFFLGPVLSLTPSGCNSGSSDHTGFFTARNTPWIFPPPHFSLVLSGIRRSS